MSEAEPEGAEKRGGDVKRLARCPICRKAAVETFRPFCSKRCADIDLNRWLGGHYAIPAEEAGAPAGEDAPGLGQ
jgi:uncharacterized protein